MSRPRLALHRAFGALAFFTSCASPETRPLPPNTFAFGVFGDGPYRAWEIGRFKSVIADVNRADVRWLIHVGDILWYPCSNHAFAGRLATLNSIRAPVVYTPGDNEWTDCHERIAGEYQPLERLQQLRSMFFASPGRTIGGRSMDVVSQSADGAFAEFVENVRWRFGGFVFATIHIVGSGNASSPFAGRTAADDSEVQRRTQAALAWLEQAFAAARSGGAHGVVIAMHGDPYFEEPRTMRAAYKPLLDRLEQMVRAFQGEVLLIHGDSHEFIVDHPLVDPQSGRTLANFTRLETFGSPDIGWVRVVVDSMRGRIVDYQPRSTSRWRLW